MEFHLITVVWGHSYVDSYLKVDLPLQLCPGNLGAFKNRHAIYRIFTTTEDKETIRQSPIFKKLESLIRVDFIEIKRQATFDAIGQMNDCHQV